MFRFSLRSFLTLLTVVTINICAVVWTIQWVGYLLLFLFLLSWAGWTYYLMRSRAWFREHPALTIGGMFLAVYILFSIEIYAVQQWTWVHPPPRPMFHNELGVHEFAVLADWVGPYRLTDQAGNLAWADVADNLLVLVVNRNDSFTTQIACGLQESQIEVSDLHWVTIPRKSDRVVVIRKDGTKRSYTIAREVVQSFYEERRFVKSRNLLDDVTALLKPRDGLDLQAFLQGPDPEAIRSPY